MRQSPLKYEWSSSGPGTRSARPCAPFGGGPGGIHPAGRRVRALAVDGSTAVRRQREALGIAHARTIHVSWEIAVILSLGSALGSLWLARTVVVRLPPDYFVGEPTRSRSGRLAWI